MKISDRLISIQQPEIESKAEKYKGPDSIKQDGNNITIPEEILDTFEDARRKAADGVGPAVLERILQDKFEQSRETRISSPVSKYNGPDSIEVAKPISEVEKYKGPKSLPENGIESKTEKYKGPDSRKQDGTDIEIPQEILDQLERARNNPPDLLSQLTRILQNQNQKEESSEPKIVSKTNQYTGPKYIGDK